MHILGVIIFVTVLGSCAYLTGIKYGFIEGLIVFMLIGSLCDIRTQLLTLCERYELSNKLIKEQNQMMNSYLEKISHSSQEE